MYSGDSGRLTSTSPSVAYHQSSLSYFGNQPDLDNRTDGYARSQFKPDRPHAAPSPLVVRNVRASHASVGVGDYRPQTSQAHYGYGSCGGAYHPQSPVRGYARPSSVMSPFLGRSQLLEASQNGAVWSSPRSSLEERRVEEISDPVRKLLDGAKFEANRFNNEAARTRYGMAIEIIGRNSDLASDGFFKLLTGRAYFEFGQFLIGQKEEELGRKYLAIAANFGGSLTLPAGSMVPPGTPLVDTTKLGWERFAPTPQSTLANASPKENDRPLQLDDLKPVATPRNLFGPAPDAEGQVSPVKLRLPQGLGTPDDRGRSRDLNEQAVAFNEKKWRDHFAVDVNPAPALPHNIGEILAGPCPYWPGKSVGKTHILVYLPRTIDGQPITMKHFEESVRAFNNSDREKISRIELEGGYWYLMTKEHLPGTTNNSFDDKCSQLKEGYQVPRAFEVLMGILSHCARGGESICSNNLILCEDKVSKNSHLLLGHTASVNMGGEDIVQIFASGYVPESNSQSVVDRQVGILGVKRLPVGCLSK